MIIHLNQNLFYHSLINVQNSNKHSKKSFTELGISFISKVIQIKFYINENYKDPITDVVDLQNVNQLSSLILPPMIVLLEMIPNIAVCYLNIVQCFSFFISSLFIIHCQWNFYSIFKVNEHC